MKSGSHALTKTLLAMKLTIILITACIIQVQAKTYSQKVSFSGRDVSLIKVFSAIEAQSGYVFFYDRSLIIGVRPVTIHVDRVPVEEVLREVLKNEPLEFTIRRKTIFINSTKQIVNRGNSRPLTNYTDTVIDRTIAGKVEDADGMPLAGVSVLEKGTSNGTATDSGGHYRLRIADGDATLIFSIIGYASQDIKIKDRSEVNIALEQDTRAMSDVVVVGYGTQKRSDLTGSLSSVSSDQLNTVPTSRRIDQALQGLAAGVNVTQTDAQPGGNVKIQIRGGNSIQGNNAPVFVVDGFVGPGNIADINPSDIESIEILKDASATAIYGARGANGVIMVTTKKGKAGKPSLDLAVNYGVQQIRNKLDMLNATEFAELVNEQRANDGQPPYYENPAALGKGTDWQDELFRSAAIQDYTLSFSGGNEASKYFISGNYFSQDGIIINSGFKRGTLRANINNKINEKLNIGTNLTASFSVRDGVSVNTDPLNTSPNVINTAIRYSPAAPVYDENGNYYYDLEFSPTVDNPIALAKEQTRNFTTNRFLGTFFAEYEILQGLTFKMTFGGNLINSKDNFYNPKTTLTGLAANGSATIDNQLETNWMNDNILTWKKTINENHSFSVLGGYTQQAYRSQSSSARSQGFVTDELLYNNLGLGENFLRPASGSSSWSLKSYLARVTYNYRDKYLFTGTARADGSSKFGADNKWGYFPSGSIKWRISEESFMQSLFFLHDLSVRASYGLTGNEGIGSFNSLASLNSGMNYILGDDARVGVGPGRIANPNLKWESTAQTDVGLDVSVYNSRLSLTVDYYNKRTTDLLFNMSVPSQSGYSTAIVNIGSIGNKGWEFSLTSRNLQGAFSWNTTANLYWNRSTVLGLGGAPEELYGTSFYLAVGRFYRLKIGEPVGTYYGYVDDGIFQNEDDVQKGAQPAAKPGDIRYVDLDGDGRITAGNDQTGIGNAQATFNYGFINDFSFKGFDLNIFINGVQGSKILNLNNIDLWDVSGQQNNSREVLNRWTPDNPSKKISRATKSRNTQVSSRFVEDASYLRVKNILLGYNLPAKLTSAIKIKSARVFLSAQNMITITKYSGYDPEVNSRGEDNVQIGTDFGAYPTARIITAGLNVKF